MITFPHVMVLFAVFGLMMTAINFLPPLMTSAQEQYKRRFGGRSRELDQLFLRMKPSHILIAALGVGVLIGVLTQSLIFGSLAVASGVFAPRIVLSLWKDMRSSQFEAQFIDALTLINNALKSGLDIATGLELVAANTKPPMSEEFGLVVNAYRLGASLDNALMDMTNRIQSRGLETAISAIIIQRETGGNLIKTFEQLVATIRDENKLQQKIRALSAQGRTQITFLAVFPWLLAVLFYFISPDMFGPALSNSWGQAVLGFLIIWEILGIIVTKKIVTVDV